MWQNKEFSVKNEFKEKLYYFFLTGFKKKDNWTVKFLLFKTNKVISSVNLCQKKITKKYISLIFF